MEPLDYLKAIAARWRIVVAVALAAIVAAVWTTPASPSPVDTVDSYSATTTLLRNAADANPNPPPLAYVKLFATLGQVPVRVAKKLDYDGEPALLASTVNVVPDDTTGSVQITAEGPDGSWDARVANTFADELIATLLESARQTRTDEIARLAAQRDAAWASVQANSGSSNPALQKKAQSDGARFADLDSQIQGLQAQNSQAAPPFTVLERATPIPAASPGILSAPRGRAGRLLLGGLAGLLAGAAIALAVARVDTRLRTRADAETAFELPVLADIPRAHLRSRRRFRIAVVDDPGGAIADGYRSLRSALLLLDPRQLLPGRPAATTAERPKVLLVTSARAGEGKTTSVANLAAAMAETGRRVLVIDCDLRNPMAYRYFRVEPGQGITDLPVAGGLELKAPTCVPRVDLIQAGTGAYAHVAVSLALPGIVEAARKQVDVILIDAPPLLVGNTAMDAMSVADAVLVVCRAGRTSREQAQRARDLIERIGVPAYGIGFIASAESQLSRMFPLPSERRSGRVPASPAASEPTQDDRPAPARQPRVASRTPALPRPTVPTPRATDGAPGTPGSKPVAATSKHKRGAVNRQNAKPAEPTAVAVPVTGPPLVENPAVEPPVERQLLAEAAVEAPADTEPDPARAEAGQDSARPDSPAEPMSIAQRVGREPVNAADGNTGAAWSRNQQSPAADDDRRGRRRP